MAGGGGFMTHRLKSTVLDLVKVYDSLNSDLCRLNLGYVVWSWAQLRQNVKLSRAHLCSPFSRYSMQCMEVIEASDAGLLSPRKAECFLWKSEHFMLYQS